MENLDLIKLNEKYGKFIFHLIYKFGSKNHRSRLLMDDVKQELNLKLFQLYTKHGFTFLMSNPNYVLTALKRVAIQQFSSIFKTINHETTNLIGNYSDHRFDPELMLFKTPLDYLVKYKTKILKRILDKKEFEMLMNIVSFINETHQEPTLKELTDRYYPMESNWRGTNWQVKDRLFYKLRNFS